jgi:hypothetical protein
MKKELQAVITTDEEDLALCHIKVVIPQPLAATLYDLLQRAKTVLQKMVADRNYVPPASVLPTVIVDGLRERYQKNPEFTRLTNWGIMIAGQDGKEIKLAKGGIRVPAVFGKEILPVKFPRKVVGNIISIEFFKQRVYGKPQPEKQKMAASIDYKTRSLRRLDPKFARALQLKGAAKIKGTPEATERARKGAKALWDNQPAPVVPTSLAKNPGLLKILAQTDILDDRECGIIKARYGLGGSAVRTLEEIGAELGITRERVRQLQNAALVKIEYEALLRSQKKLSAKADRKPATAADLRKLKAELEAGKTA